MIKVARRNYSLREEEEKVCTDTNVLMSNAFHRAGYIDEPRQNPWPSRARLVIFWGNCYAVHAPNPHFPEHGDVWHPQGRVYSEDTLLKLLKRNPNNHTFVFQTREVANALGYEARLLFPSSKKRTI